MPVCSSITAAVQIAVLLHCRLQLDLQFVIVDLCLERAELQVENSSSHLVISQLQVRVSEACHLVCCSGCT